ncbi:MAG: aminotransferase class I/II-fold pyridoxal phosphate-dependent enzyme, partial [Muribaculaceae bacterium]|nr:aminotransferase class I/II-fold pyridoxal phosphate-dependent enzyme [Muribaculaceae bacterium]
MPEQFLKTLEEEGRLRTIPEEGDSQHVDLLSNDYMGLALRAGEFIDEFREMLTQAPEPLMFSSSASRLLSRLQYWPDTLENELAGYYHKSTLLFNSGYHANVGCLSAISNLDSTLILSDKLNHASAIDGLRLGAREVKRFPHNDISKLEKILERNADNYKRVIIVVEA